MQALKTLLDLPVIQGIAMTHCPRENSASQDVQLYFHCKNSTLKDRIRDAIEAPTISVATATKESGFVEWKTNDHYVCSYEVTCETHLFVLMNSDLVSVKLLAAKQLKSALAEDISQAVLAFKSLTNEGSLTRSVAEITSDSQTASLVDAPSMTTNATAEEMLNLFNHLSHYTNKYLGNALTAKYLQSSRPNVAWLSNFEVNGLAQVTFAGIPTEVLTPLHLQWFQKWMSNFTQYCSLVIKDFPRMLEQEQKNKLLSQAIAA